VGGELKSHSQESAKIIEKIEGFEDVVPIVLQHHEHYDATGYPNQLKGEEICYLARILTLADSFDAMASVRPYQSTKTYNQAIQEIMDCTGTHFDPKLAVEFVAAMERESPI
jgi:HD-GYP domain-containing protein (c-di-GMP phosphodiesterase class II)